MIRALPAAVLIAATAAAAAPQPAVEPAPGPLASASIAWEAELPATPRRPPIPLRLSDGTTVLLLCFERALEARRLEDGSLRWRRDGLAASGLELLASGASRKVLGWAGDDGRGAGELVLLDALGGETRSATPLEAAAAGPPLRSRSDGEDVWFVPLASGSVAEIDAAGRLVSEHELERPIDGPIIDVLGRPVAVSGEQRRLIEIRSGRRVGVRRLDPQTVVWDGDWLFGASGSDLCGYRCRERRSGRLSCRRRWCQDLAGLVTSPPLMLDDRVVAGARDTFAYAFRKDNGHLLWRTREGQRLEARPLRAGGSVLLVPTAPRVSAMTIASGSLSGRLSGHSDETFPVGGALVDGLLVVPAERPPLTSLLRAWHIDAGQTEPGPLCVGPCRDRDAERRRGTRNPGEAAQQPGAGEHDQYPGPPEKGREQESPETAQDSTGASTSSPRSAARKRSSSIR